MSHTFAQFKFEGLISTHARIKLGAIDKSAGIMQRNLATVVWRLVASALFQDFLKDTAIARYIKFVCFACHFLCYISRVFQIDTNLASYGYEKA